MNFKSIKFNPLTFFYSALGMRLPKPKDRLKVNNGIKMVAVDNSGLNFLIVVLWLSFNIKEKSGNVK